MLGNAVRSKEFEWNLLLSRLPKPFDRALWDMLPQTNNAYYDPTWGRQVRFVGSHPLAGNEKRGPQAATAELFEGRVVVVTPAAATTATPVPTAFTASRPATMTPRPRPRPRQSPIVYQAPTRPV